MNRFSVAIFASLIIAAPGFQAVAAPLDTPPLSLDADPAQATPLDEPAPEKVGPEPVSQAELEAGNIWAVDPRLKSPAVQLARAVLEEGKVDDCLKHLKQAFREDASLPPPMLMLAYLHLSKGRLPQAVDALEQAGTANPNHPEVFYTAGQLALMQGRTLDAAVHFEKAMSTTAPAEWPDAFKANFPILCLAGLADVAQRRRDWAGADQIFRQWSARDAEDAQLYDRWGETLFLLGRVDESRKTFAKSYHLDPAMNPPELSLASLHAKAGKLAEAERLYAQAEELYADDARVYFEHAGALLIAGQPAPAKKQIDKALAAKNNAKQLGIELPLVQGYIARSLKDYEQAEKSFTEVLRLQPGHFQAMQQLPLVLVEQTDESKKKRAMQLAMIFAQKHKQSPQALSTLGWVLYRSDRKEEAEKILRLGGDGSPEYLFMLGQVLLDQGKAEEAKPIVKALQTQIDQPGLFLTRTDAREWLTAVSLAFE